MTSEQKTQIKYKEVVGTDPGCYRKYNVIPSFQQKCWNCKLDKDKLYFCSDCGIVRYCSRNCQKLDRMRHRVECQDVHGVSWIMRDFARNEEALFHRGLEIDCVSANTKNDILQGKDVRGCFPTAQILAGLLSDIQSGFYPKFETVFWHLKNAENDTFESFHNTIRTQPLLQSEKGLPTALIYSCTVTAISDKSERQFNHFFTITQYGPKDGTCTYRLWQAYSLGADKLIYSLDDWFDPSFELPHVDSDLRREMNATIFQEKFMSPLNNILTSSEKRSENWQSLFGWDGLPHCDRVLLYFIIGYAYYSKLHAKMRLN